MTTEVIRLGECLLTHGTLIRPFVGVCGDVTQIPMLMDERSIAGAASERFIIAICGGGCSAGHWRYRVRWCRSDLVVLLWLLGWLMMMRIMNETV